jgi:hypothetical protein
MLSKKYKDDFGFHPKTKLKFISKIEILFETGKGIKTKDSVLWQYEMSIKVYLHFESVFTLQDKKDNADVVTQISEVQKSLPELKLKSELDAVYIRHFDKQNNKIDLGVLSQIWKGLFPVEYYPTLTELK